MKELREKIRDLQNRVKFLEDERLREKGINPNDTRSAYDLSKDLIRKSKRRRRNNP